MKQLLSSTILFAVTTSLMHAEDVAKPWSSVTFSVAESNAAATVALQGSDSLTKVKLGIIGKSIEIPEVELEGIDKPVLDSAQLYFGEDWYGEWKEGEKPTPHYIIEMSYGEKSKFGNLPTVKFLFHSGKYQERIVLVQETANVWKEFRKLPGEPAVETGTTTRPASPSKDEAEINR
ncbi:hypothetical protein [Haloferula sp.]|uniref:hypothetical protein n=1 Tax=Haloferula sp. TaxID=2497595 RepID=UPI003C7662E4